MNLRRKLLTAFGALAVLVLLTAGIMFWVISQWKTTNAQIEDHYQRSLLLQRVRASTFRAFKEVADAVTGDDPDSREEFDEYLQPAEEDFQRWAQLADSDEEREEVRRVRAAYDVLVEVARQTFSLVEANRRDEAFQLMEGRLEDNDFEQFRVATEEAVTSDQRKRQVIREGNTRTKRTAQIVLSAAAFSAISLVLLLAAYLASDLFAPLRDIEASLKAASQGDFKKRLDEERADEFGAVNREYNRLVEQTARREQMAASGDNDDPTRDETTTASRLTLHTLVAQLRARILRFANANSSDDTGDTAEAKQALVAKIEEWAQAVARVTEFGFPLDLNLARTDIRALLYEVMLRFHEDFAARGIGFEINVTPEVEYATVDRLKLRQAVGELVRSALAALPETGGRIGLRARIADDDQLLIEIADDGAGTSELSVDKTFDGHGTPRTASQRIGLRLTKAVIEEHGGQLEVYSNQDEGTHVTLRLPMRA